ncbi:MAG: YtxH domain-containing protein [Candidatus Ozemobacteraceae bacterium]
MSYMAIFSRFTGPIIGGLLGFAYHKLVGCSGGTCPIVANPYLSTIYGVLLGVAFQAGR